MQHESAIIDLLTEIRNNQLKEIEYREQALAMSRNAIRGQRRVLIIIAIFTVGTVAFFAWLAWRATQMNSEFDRIAQIASTTRS